MKNKNRNLYRSILVLSFVAVNAAILFGIGEVWVYMNSGADKSSILHLAGRTEDHYRPEIEWQIAENEGRPMEAQTLRDIERDYLRSWYVRSVAFAGNDPYGLEDYFTDSMRLKLNRILELNRANGTIVRETTLEHHPRLEFYSTDGKIVILTDEDIDSFHEIYQEGQRLHSSRERRSYRIMMLLEDGFWRIRHMEEIDRAGDFTLSSENEVKVEVNGIKGLNYYPAHTPWDTFGKGFDREVIRSDFQLIHGMGLNTIRIFVPYQDFGEADIDGESLEKLTSVLDLAHSSGLQVLLTLFDFYGDYDLMDWTRTHRHAETLVTSLVSHPALFGWDIKNEPDLDFASRGKDEVLAWLREMIRQIRRWDGVHPVTIGWSSAEAASLLAEEVDFISFHSYGSPYSFRRSLSELRRDAGNKPVVITEFGASSYSGIWNVYRGSQKEQARYYREMLGILEEEGLPFLSWTLYDFDEVPTRVVGRLPWRKAPQRNFGLLEVDGTRKPAFDTLIGTSRK